MSDATARGDSFPPHDDAAEAALLRDPATGWYHDWYLRLRLEEEVARAARHERSLSLVVLRAAGGDDVNRRRLQVALAAFAATGLRATDLPCLTSQGDYVIVLPETDLAGAEVVASRLRESLTGFEPHTGTATYADGLTAGALLEAERRG